MIITFGGPPGSGKDTVANLLIKKLLELGLNYEFLAIGDIKRLAAKNKNMTIEEYNAWSANNPKEGDFYFEEFQREYVKKNNNVLIVAKLGFYAVPDSFKIYLDVDPYEGAKRIYNQKLKDNNARNEIMCKSIDEQMALCQNRIQTDAKRYLHIYKVNPYEEDNFDFVIDSTKKNSEEITTIILNKIKDKL